MEFLPHICSSITFLTAYYSLTHSLPTPTNSYIECNNNAHDFKQCLVTYKNKSICLYVHNTCICVCIYEPGFLFSSHHVPTKHSDFKLKLKICFFFIISFTFSSIPMWVSNPIAKLNSVHTVIQSHSLTNYLLTN